MNGKGRIVWGIGFIAVAVFLILNQLGFITERLSAGNVIIGLLCCAMLISGIISRSFEGIFFALGIAWLTFDEVLGLPQIGVFTMLLIVVLLIIGFHLIFPKTVGNKNHNFEKWSAYHMEDQKGEYQSVTDEEKDGYFQCSNRFGALAKYVNSPDFKGAAITNSFGELKVYLDQANITGASAEILVSNSFGQLELYIPREWEVIQKINVFAGEVTQKQNNPGIGEKKLIINGNVSFGEIELIYV